jgi:hypothetical protein
LEAAVRIVLALLLLVLTALAQRQPTWPLPPEPAEARIPVSRPKPEPPKVMQIDIAQLQREQKELAELADSVHADLAQISRGLLPKETAEKLTRIEKLAKHMRGELKVR